MEKFQVGQENMLQHDQVKMSLSESEETSRVVPSSRDLKFKNFGEFNENFLEQFNDGILRIRNGLDRCSNELNSVKQNLKTSKNDIRSRENSYEAKDTIIQFQK